MKNKFFVYIHIDFNLKPRFLSKIGYYIVPTPSTALVLKIQMEKTINYQMQFEILVHFYKRAFIIMDDWSQKSGSSTKILR